jgi:hypothetical protein
MPRIWPMLMIAGSLMVDPSDRAKFLAVNEDPLPPRALSSGDVGASVRRDGRAVRHHGGRPRLHRG